MSPKISLTRINNVNFPVLNLLVEQSVQMNRSVHVQDGSGDLTLVTDQSEFSDYL